MVVVAIRCPICGAGPKEKCSLHSGQDRVEKHSDRPEILRPDTDAATKLATRKANGTNGLQRIQKSL
jgi:hypothetical protein